MTDFLDVKRKEIEERLEELRPLIQEHDQLEKALQALAGVESPAPARPRRRAAATRTRARAPRARAPRARRSAASSGSAGTSRRSGGGTRGEQATKLIASRPGITIPELATEMGIKQNYLYRVIPALESDGKVRREGRGWYPVADSSAS